MILLPPTERHHTRGPCDRKGYLMFGSPAPAGGLTSSVGFTPDRDTTLIDRWVRNGSTSRRAISPIRPQKDPRKLEECERSNFRYG